jgi:4'-phosphopantetheinyl transferase
MGAHVTSKRVPAASRESLRRDEVHLWWGRSDAVESLDSVLASLSDEERRRGERFLQERNVHAFLFRRAFLRAVLARYVGGSPEELRFAAGEFGKPALLERGGELAFNASSRAGVVLVGVALGRELGVDVEEFPGTVFADPEEFARLVPRVTTAGEARALGALPPSARGQAFAELWTRKEALLKALGTGLSREPSTLGVGLAGGATDPEVFGAPCVARWLEVAAPQGFLASAVVAADPDERIVPSVVVPEPGWPASTG